MSIWKIHCVSFKNKMPKLNLHIGHVFSGNIFVLKFYITKRVHLSFVLKHLTSIRKKSRGYFTLNYPPKGVDLPIFKNFNKLETVFAFGQNLVMEHLKPATFPPIRGSSGTGKPREYHNMKAGSIQLTAGVK